MRRLIVAMIIMVLAVTGISIYVLLRTVEMADEITGTLEKTDQAIVGGNWGRARVELKTLHLQWSRALSFWAPIMDHAELEDLEQAITRLTRYTQERDVVEARTEVALAQLAIESLKEKELPRLANIF